MVLPAGACRVALAGAWMVSPVGVCGVAQVGAYSVPLAGVWRTMGISSGWVLVRSIVAVALFMMVAGPGLVVSSTTEPMSEPLFQG